MYALVLAGGKGERLRPLTDSLPKPLVPALGKPLVWYQVQWLKAAGVTDVVFCCGYRWEALRDAFGDGSALGLRVQYSVEEQPLGRGGALRKGFELVPADQPRVFACNGDSVTAEPARAILATHLAHPGALATLLLVPMPSPYGVVEVDGDGRVSAFREKIRLPIWMNAGMYVLERSIARLLPEVGDHETSTFPELAQQGKLLAHCTEAYWKGVDNLKDLRELEEALADGLVPTAT